MPLFHLSTRYLHLASRINRSRLRLFYSSDSLNQEIAFYAKNKTPTGVPLLTMMQTGRGDFVDNTTSCEKTRKQQMLYQIAVFLHRELPIRIAYLISDLDHIPYLRDVKGSRDIRNMYAQSFDDLRASRMPTTIEHEKNFAKITSDVLNKYANVLIAMAKSVQEIRSKYDEIEFADQIQIHQFLDSFYMSRIGIRMLIGQYLALREDQSPGHVGLISERVSPAAVTRDAIADAKFMCERVYGFAPEVTIHGRKDLTFQYDPSHLHYILLELLKNSMRATIEFHGKDNDEDWPRIRVVIADGVDNEDVVIKVSDEGGGISRSNMTRIWSYLFTTANPDVQESMLSEASDFSTSSPLAGLGYGLPIARTYARYFGGDLNIMSMEGYGTDAYVHCSRVGTHSEPVPCRFSS